MQVGELTANKYGVSCWGDEMFWNYLGTIVIQSLTVLNTTELYIPKGMNFHHKLYIKTFF